MGFIYKHGAFFFFWLAKSVQCGVQEVKYQCLLQQNIDLIRRSAQAQFHLSGLVISRI